MVKKYNLGGKVQFIDHSFDIPALLMLSDVVLSTAIEPEAFGRIAAEGEAMGKIVIASNIGGSLDNLKNNITGYHFESGNALDLSKKITKALDLDDKTRAEIASSAQNYIKENFTKQIMCDKTLEVYQNVVNNN
jgi:glycosyltransferase involved in cell wall biosynthesis